MKSTPEEIASAKEMVRTTELQIRDLVCKDKKVHVVWDFDFVLASGLSDDIFSLVKFDLKKYFEYEARLCWSCPEQGIWLPLATSVGLLHHSQDIVTTRSSYLAFRVMNFCLMKSMNPNWIRWMLFLGHQTKSDSFRIILDSFKNQPDVHIFFVDDAKKHVDAFLKTSSELEMSERTTGIVSPQVRNYTEEELEQHYNAVMASTGDKPVLVPHYSGCGNFTVLPNGLSDFRKEAMGTNVNLHQEAIVEGLRDVLEDFHDEMMPDKPKTTENLYFLYELLKEPNR